jgi:neuroblastoma-amplified sequence
MLKLQAKVFTCIEIETCFEVRHPYPESICHSTNFACSEQIYAETLLASGSKSNIRYAGQIMECSRAESKESTQQKIAYEVSVALILKASREYFDSSESLSDLSMEYSK